MFRKVSEHFQDIAEQEFYNSGVPTNAQLTETTFEAPASTNENLDTKARFIEMRVSQNGFDPATITVSKGDTLYIDLMPQDGDYDLSIPFLGASFSMVEEGGTRRLPLDTTLEGTFKFTCANNCPGSGPIEGQLIVLP